MGLVRRLFCAAGFASLGAAALGAALPVLPTTPFVLLAAWCFSKGSPRLHRRLLASRAFGPLVLNWRRHGVIRPRAKALSGALIVLFFAFSLAFTELAPVLKALLACVGAAVLGFILTRPGAPKGGGGRGGGRGGGEA